MFCTQATNLKKVTVNAQCDVGFDGQYYTDGETAWYSDVVQYPRVRLIGIDQLATLPSYKITIKQGQETYVFEKSEYEVEGCTKGDFYVSAGNTVSDGTTTVISGISIDIGVSQDLEITFE